MRRIWPILVLAKNSISLCQAFEIAIFNDHELPCLWGNWMQLKHFITRKMSLQA
jgi:hypothetical protein